MSADGIDTWHAMYCGALLALGLRVPDAAQWLAELTRSDDECAHAIVVMARAPELKRVTSALDALREIRSSESAKADTERPVAP